MVKTVLFEDKYKTEINKFSSTDQVTDFLEDKLHKRLKVVSLNQNLVSNRGNIFPISNKDIDKEFDKALKSDSNKIVRLLKKL